MKLFSSILAFCLLFGVLNAQIIPTEIMYNPPETGNDSLEFLELYNTTDQAIELDGYRFIDGILYDFGDETIEANGYLVLAINGEAFENQYGFAPDAVWDAPRALGNSGDELILEDNAGNIVFTIEFSDRNPWPSEPDGNGPSLELCDLEADYSLASSWGTATTATGIIIDGVEVLASPKAANDPDCGLTYDHRIEVTNTEFTPADLTISVDEVVLWENLEGDHNVDGRTSTYPDNPSSFYSGDVESAPWTFTHRFTEEGVYDYECSAHAGLGMVGTITVESDSTGEEYPLYEISDVRPVDAEGIPDSLGVQCALIGVIHGANRRSGGYEFTMIDAQGNGINVFSPSTRGDYEAEQGDEVRVEGTIAQFNGLTQIEVDNIFELNTDVDLLDAELIAEELSEEWEGKFIGINDVTITDPENWDESGNSFNIEVVAPNSITYSVRIDNDTELAGLSMPPVAGGLEGTFYIQGVVGQFDPTPPYDEGYQLFPSFESDLQGISSAGDLLVKGMRFYPNPVRDHLTVEGIPSEIRQIEIYDLSGKRLRTIHLQGTKFEIPMNDLQKGTYLLSTVWDGKRIPLESIQKQ